RHFRAARAHGRPARRSVRGLLASPRPECKAVPMEWNVAKFWRRVEAELFEPRAANLRRPLALALHVLRYPYALARDLIVGDLNLRAMSLVYTTLLSIVPLIAFGFSILKGLGVHEQLEPLIYEFFRPLGDRATELTARVTGFVDNVQGTVLGSVGLAFLVWTVISVIQKVEEALNFIWHVERVRSFARRFSEYLSVMVVGPILMVTAFGLIASLSANSAVQWLQSHEPFGTILVMLGELGPLFLVSAWLAFLYSFIPNTRVKPAAALIAGVVAGAAWVAASFGFAQLVAYSSQMMAIYASFSIVLLALIWVWLNWLVLLLGAQLAFYVQHPAALRLGRQEPRVSNGLRERMALNVMYLVGESFRRGGPPCTTGSIAAATRLPGLLLGRTIAELEAAGLISATQEEALVPGRDLARITLGEILAAVRAGEEPGELAQPAWSGPVAEVMDGVDAAIAARTRDITLATLLDRAPAG
ncbi:MAG: YihY family inner membrane protein, partial [Planctomycetes bacterium]|nr:YihY family inner membrane protein [Planctomycetota bacterium]